MTHQSFDSLQFQPVLPDPDQPSEQVVIYNTSSVLALTIFSATCWLIYLARCLHESQKKFLAHSLMSLEYDVSIRYARFDSRKAGIEDLIYSAVLLIQTLLIQTGDYCILYI